jgi:Cd2+/Zn2+-exporting ATPase
MQKNVIVKDKVSASHCDTCVDSSSSVTASVFDVEKLLKVLTPVSGLLFLIGFAWSFTPDMEKWGTFFYFLSLATGSVFVLRSAWNGLWQKKFLNISFLVVIASLGAIYIGEYGEAAAVVFLFSLAEFFESYGIERSRRAVAALLQRSPKTARLQDGTVVPVESVIVKSIVVVKPGEQVPLDGKVSKGSSAIDTSAVTGESAPVDVQIGDAVFAGTMNIQGYLEILVEKESGNSMFARIISLVKEAQASQAPTEAFIDSFARYYTPIVVVLAVLVATLPIFLFDQSFDIWLYRALVLLVIACPCALVISTPVAIASAIGGASRRGVLIKGGVYLEKLAKLKAIAFDKTRTLTYGRHRVTDVLVFGNHSADEVIADAAGIEQLSSHPLAESILTYAKEHNIKPHTMHAYENIAGKGGHAECSVCDAHNYIGNAKLMLQYGIADKAFIHDIEHLEKEGKTVVLVAEGTEVIGAIGISDEVREEAKGVITTLTGLGIQSTMLSGDNVHSASAIGKIVGITDIHASLSPEDKVEAVRSLTETYGPVGMVGDGVNDAPALALADVGIAIGAGGTDVAIETADIALLSGNLETIPYSVKLARKTMRTIRTNITLALGVKVVFLTLVVLGHSNLVFAIAADSGMALLVILNSLRLFTVK